MRSRTRERKKRSVVVSRSTGVSSERRMAMCGGGDPFSPFGFHLGQGVKQVPLSPYEMQAQQMQAQQMMGMQNMYGPGTGITGLNDSTRISDLPEILNRWAADKPVPKKKCVCLYCGRPAKPAQENACPGCGAWEVEFK